MSIRRVALNRKRRSPSTEPEKSKLPVASTKALRK
jgi:hypothetical protein